jgi:outer membrane receptor protein involved in Fe transport
VVNNVFNKEPPLDVVALGTESSGYSTYGDPRLANYSLSIRKSF